MSLENDQAYYQRRAEQQLQIANTAVDLTIKYIHLNLASRYATLSQLAARDDPANRARMTALTQVMTSR